MSQGGGGARLRVYNTSPFTFETLREQDPTQIHQNLVDYVTGFSSDIHDIFIRKFRLIGELTRLNEAGILWEIFKRFCGVDLHPDMVSSLEMGYLFENLIRRFSEISNETAGEHFTPREVIHLIVDLLITNDRDALSGSGVIRTVYDPACGTGGMLSLTEEALQSLNSKVTVELYGQELNPESFAICKSEMLMSDHKPQQIAFGNTLINDIHTNSRFHYMLCNPPYGVDWAKHQEPIRQEYETKGFDGRFGAGLPPVSDGQLLFLQHMISKMRSDERGSRIGIVMNGSPLFAGKAGSGESEIRRWILENDWLEAIIALPAKLFYNTAIQTYIWLLSNRKPPERHGKVQFIDASSERFWKLMPKSLGKKQREIPEKARNEIVRIYANVLNGECPEDWNDYTKILSTVDLGYREIRVERPLRLNFQASQKRMDQLTGEKAIQKMGKTEKDTLLHALASHMPDTLFTNREDFSEVLAKVLNEANIKVSATVRKAIISAFSKRDEEANPCIKRNGSQEPDTKLRDLELVPMKKNWRNYMAQEVKPYAKDAWVDETYRDKADGEIGRVGYKINFDRYFYEYDPPRAPEEINAELEVLEQDIAALLCKVKYD